MKHSQENNRNGQPHSLATFRYMKNCLILFVTALNIVQPYHESLKPATPSIVQARLVANMEILACLNPQIGSEGKGYHKNQNFESYQRYFNHITNPVILLHLHYSDFVTSCFTQASLNLMFYINMTSRLIVIQKRKNITIHYSGQLYYVTGKIMSG